MSQEFGAPALGGQALTRIDKVLGQRPHKDDASLSDAAKALCSWRDQLVTAGRAAGQDAEALRRLRDLNGVISMVIAMHFPLGDTPWADLEAARGWLVQLIAQGGEGGVQAASV